MARPKFRLVAKPKDGSPSFEVAAAWPATRGRDGEAIPGVFNLRMSRNKEGDFANLAVVRPGSKAKLSDEDVFLSLYVSDEEEDRENF